MNAGSRSFRDDKPAPHRKSSPLQSKRVDRMRQATPQLKISQQSKRIHERLQQATPCTISRDKDADMSISSDPVAARRIWWSSNSDTKDVPQEPKDLSTESSDRASDANPCNCSGRFWRRRRDESNFYPEERIKLFAFRLAFVEKAASGLGYLAFLWATVVILGGFATSLTIDDFWVVAVIIFAEALRIFTRVHELEWHRISNEGGKSEKSERMISLCPFSRSIPETRALSPGDGSRWRDGLQSPSGHKSQPLSPGDESPSLKSFMRSGNGNLELNRGTQPSNGRGALRRLSKKNISFISNSVPILKHILKPRVMCMTLYILQFLSAVICIGLAIWRLSQQTFCFRDEDDGARCPGYHRNVAVTMNVFYGLAVLEAALFLLEKGYHEYRMRMKQLLETVKKDVNAKDDAEGNAEVVAEVAAEVDSLIFEKFYYTVYKMSLDGSIFDSLDMNLGAFAIQWLQSDESDEQLQAAKLLHRFVSPKSKAHQPDTLRRLSTTPGIMDRLVEMLSWNSEHERELVGEIAEIVKSLVAYDQTWSRFAAVPGALDAVVSLLFFDAENSGGEKKDQSTAKFRDTRTRVTGLEILRYLCNSYANSLEIGQTRGLLSILVWFIQVQGSSSPSEEQEQKDARWKVYRYSLEVLYHLSDNKSASGRTLRRHIAGIPSVLKNLRDVIEECDKKDSYLQLLAMDILYNLALEKNVRGTIGATAGIIRLLFKIFQQSNAGHDAVSMSSEPAKTNPSIGAESSKDFVKETHRELKDRIETSLKVLSRLTLQHKDNCRALLSLKDENRAKRVLDVMVAVLHNGENANKVGSAEILRSLMKYGDDRTRIEIADRSAKIVLPTISHPMGLDSSLRDRYRSLLYEASLGLASRALESLPSAQYKEALKHIRDCDRGQFLDQLVENLRHSPTTSKFPKIRRYSVEMIIALVERDDYFLDALVERKLEEVLEEDVLDSLSETENFILFSGLMGYERHAESMKGLVLRCIKVMDRRLSSRSKSTYPGGREVAA